MRYEKSNTKLLLSINDTLSPSYSLCDLVLENSTAYERKWIKDDLEFVRTILVHAILIQLPSFLRGCPVGLAQYFDQSLCVQTYQALVAKIFHPVFSFVQVWGIALYLIIINSQLETNINY